MVLAQDLLGKQRVDAPNLAENAPYPHPGSVQGLSVADPEVIK